MDKEIRLEFEKIELEKSKSRCKKMAIATGTLGIFKIGAIVGPKVMTLLKGSVLFLDIAIPNYFLISTAGLVIFSTVEKFIDIREKNRQESIKSGRVGKLLTLEEDDD